MGGYRERERERERERGDSVGDVIPDLTVGTSLLIQIRRGCRGKLGVTRGNQE